MWWLFIDLSSLKSQKDVRVFSGLGGAEMRRSTFKAIKSKCTEITRIIKQKTVQIRKTNKEDVPSTVTTYNKCIVKALL